MNILIIEDDIRIAQLIQRGLEEQGFATTLAYDGLSGRKLALQNNFDLIITDIILPIINGLDLCKEIRQIKPDVPIIMLRWSSLTGQLFDKFKLMKSYKPGLAVKVILKFSGDPAKEVSRINFGNNFDSGLKDKFCLCC